MQIEADFHPVRRSRSAGGRMRLDALATQLYSDPRLSPLLTQLLVSSSRLLDTLAGSISLIDEARSRYAKMAEHGASCRLGHTFPLDEGITGQVLAGRRPVVLASYSDVRRGHLPKDHVASSGAVAAVPIWWRGDVIGANVVFAGRRRRFTTSEVDELEILTQLAAAGIVQAGAGQPSLRHLLGNRRPGDAGAGRVRTVVTEVGPPRGMSPEVAGAALDLVTTAERAAARREPGARLHVAVMYRPDGLRLLAQDEAADVSAEVVRDPLSGETRRWHQIVAAAGGVAAVEHVPGWGVLARADLPYGDTSAPGQPDLPPSDPATRNNRSVASSPLTPREHEVLGLLARGLTDRDIASALVISPKTVEKHVGAILRKTGTAARTGAVMRALHLGWLPDTGRVGMQRG